MFLTAKQIIWFLSLRCKVIPDFAATDENMLQLWNLPILPRNQTNLLMPQMGPKKEKIDTNHRTQGKVS